jgi:hypothetical protein
MLCGPLVSGGCTPERDDDGVECQLFALDPLADDARAVDPPEVWLLELREEDAPPELWLPLEELGPPEEPP